jgi:hypothetical protein
VGSQKRNPVSTRETSGPRAQVSHWLAALGEHAMSWWRSSLVSATSAYSATTRAATTRNRFVLTDNHYIASRVSARPLMSYATARSVHDRFGQAQGGTRP